MNGVLSTYTDQPLTHKHSLTEFYYVVMNIFKYQQQTEYVIRAGMFALKFAENSDPLLVRFFKKISKCYFKILVNCLRTYVQSIRPSRAIL